MKPPILWFKPAFGKLKIKHKVFALISLVMAVCFLITYFSQQYAYSIYDNQLYSRSSQMLNLSASGIENELKRLDKLSFQIATDQQIQDLLLSLTFDTPEFEKYKIRSYITDRLVQYVGNESYIYSVELTDQLGGQSMAGQTPKASNQRRQQILNESTPGQGETRWVFPEAGDPYLVAAREVRSYSNLNLNRIGTLMVRIRFDKIVEDIVAGTELKNGEMHILSGSNTIYPVSTEQDPRLTLPGASAWQGGYAIKQVDGRQYFFTRIQAGYLGWSYDSLIPYDQIFQKIVLMKNILLGGFILSVVVLMAVALQFARSITRPIEDLIGLMRQVQKGDFRHAETETADWPPLPMDEVGHLQRTFRHMIRQINELITENYAKQLTIKETQFKALQAQINPHFLYNTLESINWLAKTNRQPQISSMVEALGFLLRSSISLKETLITVGEELDIVMNYLTIQKYRFDDRLIYEIDVPDNVKKLRIPKLTLQPLLENSINYGLESMLEPCLITISTKRQEGRVLIMTRDNGPGMDEQLLAQVRKGEAPTRGSGIGLKNIEERIMLAFGDAYGLHIESTAGQGTCVTVIIPDETEFS